MATRKDLLKAHSFISQRLVHALVSRNADEQSPALRRLKTGTLVGALIATLITAGFGVWGLLDPGANKRWKEESGTVLIDTTSGVSYVWLIQTDNATHVTKGLLHPTPNIASARLASGNPEAKVVKVSGRSLADEPRGVPLGIPQAPADLPDAGQLRAFPLRACSVPGAGKAARATTLEFGKSASGTTVESMLVVTEDGSLSLIFNGASHEIPGVKTVPPAFLAAAGFTPVQVDRAWLKSLPLGDQLRRLRVAGEGETPTQAVGALRVGTLGPTKDANGDVRWWLLQRDGFSQVTWLDAQLLLADGVPNVDSLDPQLVSKHMSRDTLLNAGDFPLAKPTAPGAVSSSTSVCATRPGPGKAPTITLNDGDVPDLAGRTAPAPGNAALVVLPPGRGALLSSDAAKDPNGPSSLVVNGLRYPIPDAATREMLGYRGKVQPQPVPPEVLKLIPDGLPAGGVLSHAAAMTQLA